MLIRKAEAYENGRQLKIRQEWVPIERISYDLIAEVVDAEDSHFYEHGGFSYDDMVKAIYINRCMNRVVAGGSTISQQTAKNVFCLPDRTYTRKLFEAYFTTLIELFWGKERILEVYLNVIELGDGIFGVEAASDYYFRSSAANIGKHNAKQLVYIIPCPRDYLPSDICVY